MYFSFQLAEKLKKTQKEILEIGAEELQNWVAFYALQSDDYRKSIEDKIHLENQNKLSDAERAKQLKALFTGKR